MCPPIGSLPSGSGALCYDTLANCHEGANACGTNPGDVPCKLDLGTCATGVVCAPRTGMLTS